MPRLRLISRFEDFLDMATMHFTRALLCALVGIAIGIAGFAAAQMKDHGNHAAATAAPSDRKIKYYRNPMGLPDTSAVPKQDSMGMDYIPVYEGEDSDDGSVKLSPGKIQRTGVKSEPVARRVIRTRLRAPGTIQLDERRGYGLLIRPDRLVLEEPHPTPRVDH